MPEKTPRVISLVPSWTETLINASVRVVGRTRFCIHPGHAISSIPSVGGTKKFDLDLIKRINPDFVILDKQENTKEMADQLIGADLKLLISDVTEFESLKVSLRQFAISLAAPKLNEFVDRYENLKSPAIEKFLVQWILKGDSLDFLKNQHRLQYIIWKSPFMAVGRDTFIAANLKWIGIELEQAKKYSEVSDELVKGSFNLFSSEPFPFLKFYDSLRAEGYQGVVVDGEITSWFGIRNLLFLESSQK